MSKIRYAIAGLSLAATVAVGVIYPHEGKVNHAYQDSIGVWTICRGHTQGVKKGDTATDAQCDQYFAEDMAVVERAYYRLVTRPQHPNTQAAVYSFIFNAGQGNFARSTMLKRLNVGDRHGACLEIAKWNRAGGRDCRIKKNNCRGLILRRQDEMSLCLKDNVEIENIIIAGLYGKGAT
jgi:lysozyme